MYSVVLDLVLFHLQERLCPKNAGIILRIFEAMPCHVLYNTRFFSLPKFRAQFFSRSAAVDDVAALWTYGKSVWAPTTQLICEAKNMYMMDVDEMDLFQSVPICVGTAKEALCKFPMRVEECFVEIKGPDAICKKISSESREFFVSCCGGFQVHLMGDCVEILKILQSVAGEDMMMCSTCIVFIPSPMPLSQLPEYPSNLNPVPLNEMVHPALWWIPCRRHLRPVLTLPGWYVPEIPNEYWSPWLDFTARVHNMLVRCEFLSIYQRHMNRDEFKTILETLECDADNVSTALQLVKQWAMKKTFGTTTQKMRVHMQNPMITPGDPEIKSFVIHSLVHGRAPEPGLLPSSVSIRKSAVWYTAAQTVVHRNREKFGIGKGHELVETMKLFHAMIAF